MKREIAQFLLDLLQRQQINVGAADFDEVVEKVRESKQELIKVLNNSTDKP